jgi:hypothetical protein
MVVSLFRSTTLPVLTCNSVHRWKCDCISEMTLLCWHFQNSCQWRWQHNDILERPAVLGAIFGMSETWSSVKTVNSWPWWRSLSFNLHPSLTEELVVRMSEFEHPNLANWTVSFMSCTFPHFPLRNFSQVFLNQLFQSHLWFSRSR